MNTWSKLEKILVHLSRKAQAVFMRGLGKTNGQAPKLRRTGAANYF
jgi:hypothetical protein